MDHIASDYPQSVWFRDTVFGVMTPNLFPNHSVKIPSSLTYIFSIKYNMVCGTFHSKLPCAECLWIAKSHHGFKRATGEDYGDTKAGIGRLNNRPIEWLQYS